MAMLVACLLILLVLLSPFAAVYGQKWLKIYRFDAGGEASRGTPPFHSYGEYLALRKGEPFGHTDLSSAYKIAALKFPDARSCLQPDTGEITTETLKQMDWERVHRVAEIEVCVFRLLAASGDITHATDWFEAQGFRVPDQFTSANPFVELNGNLRVYGAWSIRDNGPKFNKGSLLNRLLPDLAYSMDIHTYWSADGQQLQAVDLGFLSK